MILKYGLLVSAFIGLTTSSYSQNHRASDYNTIGWHAIFLNYQLNPNWSVHGEFQLRRVAFLEPQQNLYRAGINLRPHSQVLLRAGYAFADTHNYGKMPVTSNGLRFPEHRTFLMALLNNPIDRIDFSHRFMLEQRWVGRSLDPKALKIDEYTYLNRMRYMLRIEYPLQKDPSKRYLPYLAFYDELMIGFGKNINQNIFDQNRFGALIGYKIQKKVRIESGYLHQTLQFGRLVDGKNLFQYNQGYILNTYFNF
jgi:hypothetical protein